MEVSGKEGRHLKKREVFGGHTHTHKDKRTQSQLLQSKYKDLNLTRHGAAFGAGRPFTS